MSARSAFPGGITAGDPVSASNNNRLPGGKIGRVVLNAATSPSAGQTVIIGSGGAAAALSVACGTNRELTVMFTTNLFSTNVTGGQLAYVNISMDGTLIGHRNFWIPPHGPADNTYSIGVAYMCDARTTAAGTYAFSVTTGPIGAGGGSIHMDTSDASVYGDCLLEVHDCGPSF